MLYFTFLITFFLQAALAQVCEDKSVPGRPSDCPQNKDKCDTDIWRELMREQCPMTCGLCSTIPATNRQTRTPTRRTTQVPARSTPEYKLWYFNLRGRGEAIRLLFHYLNEPFEDFRILTFEDWVGIYKNATPFGSIPILEDLETGGQLAQQFVILRYLAKVLDFAPDSEWEEAKVDEIADFHKDVALQLMPIYLPLASNSSLQATAEQTARVENITRDYFPFYERVLTDSASGFMVPSGVSWPDFVIADFYETFQSVFPQICARYPYMESHRAAVYIFICNFCGKVSTSSHEDSNDSSHDVDSRSGKDVSMQECGPEDVNTRNCDYESDFLGVVSCYMDYFGFDHEGGFHGCRRSVLNLQGIFQFIEYYTGCDLINDLKNRKCKSEHKKGKRLEYGQGQWEDGKFIFPALPHYYLSDPPENLTQVLQSSTEGKVQKVHLNISSTRKSVQISYFEEDHSDLIPTSSEEEEQQAGDGPNFPMPTGHGSSMKVAKQGRFNANYTIEINYLNQRRLMLVLTGKSKLWFRLHCYLCGAWMEMTTDCNGTEITYSTKDLDTQHSTVTHKKFDNRIGSERDCTLWEANSTEETRRLEKKHKQDRKEKDDPEVPLDEENSTTKGPLEEVTEESQCNCKKALLEKFGDMLTPMKQNN
ncbi:shK domain-like domain-containing protein [Ditylenchus destructor]|nr:shK domain-like domain-containing protein [Ditylenchus destructor]